MKRGRGFVILAIVAALALGVGGFYGWKLLQARKNTYTMTAQFDSSAGLYPTNNVQVLGMKVGSVTKVTPKNGYVEVDFTVDKNVKIPADATVIAVGNPAPTSFAKVGPDSTAVGTSGPST